MSKLTQILKEVSRTTQQPVVTIGNFDGVHLGHQAVFNNVRTAARGRGVCSVALTFEPHPVVFFGKREPRTFCITSPQQKLDLIQSQGIDHAIALPFDLELASHSPQGFVRHILHESLGASEVWVGYDFNFGKNRSGGIEDLVRHGQNCGIDVHVHDAVSFGQDVVSSTRVRRTLTATDLELAGELLCRRHTLRGKVEKGDARGRALGFPTANITPNAGMMVKHGVYTTIARLLDSDERFAAITNIGVRPTVRKDASPNVESFILHGLPIDANLYDSLIEIELIDFLRPEMKFDSIEDLKAQIAKDVARARRTHGLPS